MADGVHNVNQSAKERTAVVKCRIGFVRISPPSQDFMRTRLKIRWDHASCWSVFKHRCVKLCYQDKLLRDPGAEPFHVPGYEAMFARKHKIVL